MIPAVGRIDVHAHIALDTPGFAEKFGDDRWPSLDVEEDGRSTLYRGGKPVRTLPAAARSLDHKIVDMDQAGIALQVLSPVPPLICDWSGGVEATEWARHLNNDLAERIAEHPTRFAGLGTVPLSCPDDAVAVLEEAKKLGLNGIQIGASVNGQELDDPQFAELFQAAAELRMLIFIHPLVLGSKAGWTERLDRLEATFGVGMTTDTAIAAARLAMRGTFENSPGLTVCLAHGGGSLPWLAPRISRLWDPSHDTSFIQLLRNFHVDSVVFNPKNVRYLVEQLGSDRVLFGTDHPLPGCDSLDGKALDDLGPGDRARVERGNAVELLNLTEHFHQE